MSKAGSDPVLTQFQLAGRLAAVALEAREQSDCPLGRLEGKQVDRAS